MTEDDARGWFADRFDRAACERVAWFLDRVTGENARQNLIAPATIPSIWVRHAVDSAQLLALAPDGWAMWIDIGTGGGFPGLIIALLQPGRKVAMVEPRRKRAEFLQDCCDRLALTRATVHATRIEAMQAQADVISARAVSSVEILLRRARHCATTSTHWLLPRGRSGQADLKSVGKLERTMFHVEHSLTDSESTILVGQGDGT